jgi:hypothetical protein
VIDPCEITLDEPVDLILTRGGVTGYFDLDFFAESPSASRDYLRPLDPGYGDVLAGRSGEDLMTFFLECFYDFEREQAHGAGEPTVVSFVVVIIACEAEARHG